MPIVPKSIADEIAFFENHNTPWSTNALAIGTTTAAVTALATQTAAARAAYNAQQAAQNAAKAATLTLKGAMDAMGIAGSDIIKSIKTKAATAGDSVYALAEIPAPATPSPVGPPGTPSDFKVALNADGSLKLTWKCTNPGAGTIYQIYRRVGASGEFTYLGGVGSKSFVDNTLPAGSSAVTYQMQAARSTAVGAWAQFNVNFGVGGSGATIVSVTEARPAAPATSARIAA